MVVQDIISLARHSELSNTALKINNSENTAAIVSFINMGMIETKKFLLMMKMSRIVYFFLTIHKYKYRL